MEASIVRCGCCEMKKKVSSSSSSSHHGYHHQCQHQPVVLISFSLSSLRIFVKVISVVEPTTVTPALVSVCFEAAISFTPEADDEVSSYFFGLLELDPSTTSELAMEPVLLGPTATHASPPSYLSLAEIVVSAKL